MAYELIYTSAERGLRPGTRGFCTVAHTQGMPPQQIQLLEALSAYKNLYSVHDTQEKAEPIAWSHLTSNLVGRSASIVSRVGATVADHTGRSNKLAHHVLLQQRERPLGGPAWLCQQSGFLRDAWDEQPHLIADMKEIPAGDYEAAPATAWEALTGDPAYAAFLPNAFKANGDAITVIAFAPGTDMLALIAESLALLEPSQRWNVTFSTYFTQLAVGASCAWRCCVADSDTLREARRNPRTTILDLTAPLPPVPTGPLAELARTGQRTTIPRIQVPKPDDSEKPKKFILMGNRNINQLTLKPRNTSDPKK